MVPLVAFSVLGGSSEVVTQVRDLNPGMLNPFYGATFLGVVSLTRMGLRLFSVNRISLCVLWLLNRFVTLKSRVELV